VPRASGGGGGEAVRGTADAGAVSVKRDKLQRESGNGPACPFPADYDTLAGGTWAAVMEGSDARELIDG
jgi:hypothetical protein